MKQRLMNRMFDLIKQRQDIADAAERARLTEEIEKLNALIHSM